MCNIAIIGAGQLGSRHLQAMSLLDVSANLYVLDPNLDSLGRAETRLQEIGYNKKLLNVRYVNEYAQLPSKFDAAIIATTSDVRRNAIECLLAQSEVKYLVLEKVLFQRVEDYTKVLALLNEHNVSAWVNCPQRTWEIYKDLATKLEPGETIEFNVSGGGWGLACNAIHYIDLFAFLTKQNDVTFSTERLVSDISVSKRAGFIEFHGTLTGSVSRGDYLALTCYPARNAPVLVQVLSNSRRYIVKENQRSVLISNAADDWLWVEHEFSVPFQSQQTHKVIKELIYTDRCQLPSFHESMSLHLPMIEAFLAFISKKSEKDVFECRIT